MKEMQIPKVLFTATAGDNIHLHRNDVVYGRHTDRIVLLCRTGKTSV